MNLCLYQIHVHLPHWLSLMKVFDSCMIFGIDPCLRYSIYYSTLPSLKHTKTVNLLIGFLFILLFFSPIVKHIALLYHSWHKLNVTSRIFSRYQFFATIATQLATLPFTFLGSSAATAIHITPEEFQLQIINDYWLHVLLNMQGYANSH